MDLLAGIHLLLVVSLLSKGAAGQMLNISVKRTKPCLTFGKNAGIVYLSGSVLLQEANITDYASKVDVYLGVFNRPKRFCTIMFGPKRCAPAPKNQDYKCRCTASRDGGKVREIDVRIPVDASNKAHHARIVWLPDVRPKRLLHYETPIFPNYGFKKASVEINGRQFVLVPGNCPAFPVGVQTNIKYCVDDLESPKIAMSFGNSHTYHYQSSCGREKITLSKHHKPALIWFSFSDSCKREENITCMQDVPFHNLKGPTVSDSCKVRAMDNLMALVAIVCLLMAYM